jgi:hypothetical protein
MKEKTREDIVKSAQIGAIILFFVLSAMAIVKAINDAGSRRYNIAQGTNVWSNVRCIKGENYTVVYTESGSTIYVYGDRTVERSN